MRPLTADVAAVSLYCSTRCRRVHAKRVKAQQSVPPTRPCRREGCYNPIEIRRGKGLGKAPIYCSEKCHPTKRWATRNKKDNPPPSPVKQIAAPGVCGHCSATFSVVSQPGSVKREMLSTQLVESWCHRHAAAVAQFAKYPDSGTGSLKALTYCALGLTGEAGEVADKVKKVLRDAGEVLSEEVRKGLSAELGDVLWYLFRCCAELGLNVEQVARENVEKLTSRQMRGVIGGSGDAR